MKAAGICQPMVADTAEANVVRERTAPLSAEELDVAPKRANSGYNRNHTTRC